MTSVGQSKNPRAARYQYGAPKSARLSIRLTKECKAKTRRYADSINLSVAELMERLLRSLPEDGVPSGPAWDDLRAGDQSTAIESVEGGPPQKEIPSLGRVCVQLEIPFGQQSTLAQGLGLDLEKVGSHRPQGVLHG